MSSMPLFTPSKTEQAWAKALRVACVHQIKSLGEAEAAEKLGVAVPGLRSLLWTPYWDLERCIRVCDVLDIDAFDVIERSMRVPRVVL